MEVLVLGSANADLIVRVERRPGPGETVLGSDTEVLPGGKGANAAVAAGRLGADVAFLGAVGPDAHGKLLLDSMRSAGVDVSQERCDEAGTGIAYITVTPDGENSIVVSPGANAQLTEAHVDAVPLGEAKVLAASLEVPVAVVEHALAAARAAGVHTVLNLAPAARLDLSAVDTLVLNRHEAAWLLNSPWEDTRLLLELGPRSVVVTLGAHGVLLHTKDRSETVGAPKVEAVDTTGAGDAFTGALATGLAAGRDLLAAAELAVRVATISVTRPGAQPSYPWAAELS
jgi:ribokinase